MCAHVYERIFLLLDICDISNEEHRYYFNSVKFSAIIISILPLSQSPSSTELSLVQEHFYGDLSVRRFFHNLNNVNLGNTFH